MQSRQHRVFHLAVYLLPALMVLLLATFTLAFAQGDQPANPVPQQFEPTPSPTPDCPEPPGDGTEQFYCERPVIQGHVFEDRNDDGQPGSGDWFLPGAVVRVYGPTGEFVAEQVTGTGGWFRFYDLAPLQGDEYYTLQLESPPPGYCIPVGPMVYYIDAQDFSSRFCCTYRANFIFMKGGCEVGGPTPTPLPRPLPPAGGPPADTTGRQVHLPILNYLGDSEGACESWIEVQNVGHDFAKAIVVFWGEAGACAPQCNGPLKVECSGLLKPGSTWNFLGSQIPAAAKSAVVFSADARQLGRDIFADALCEELFATITFDCDEYRRFKKAYNEFGVWHGFDFYTFYGQPLAVEVVRKCADESTDNLPVSSAYSGVTGGMLGAYDPEFGGFAFYAPLVYANRGGLNSTLYIHNAGTECTSVELWFKEQDDCLRATVCEIFNLAPGETYQYDAGQCVGPEWQGSAWIRTSQPMAITIDQIGRDALMTYNGAPSQIDYTFQNRDDALFTPGSQINYGPLIYREFNGWQTGVQVQNLSSVVNAKVKVYFIDNSGDIITTLVDWVCPRGSQTFFLPVINNLPGNFIGQIRVESQDWFSPGDPAVPAPNIVSVAQLIRYGDPGLTTVLEAVAYNLFTEPQVFDWQVGSGYGGLYSGVGLIGIPSLLKDLRNTGVTTELAIMNAVPQPGFTDFAIYIYDQNGLLDFVCEKLNEKQVEYINLADWGYVNPGFKGSAVISATYWQHEIFGSSYARNLVGLAAVKIERQGTVLGNDIPGDEAAGSEGFPIFGPRNFYGQFAPTLCPGQPETPGPPAP
ncbi:MAG: hypothetical protein D6791_06340 [Chloroflexi bacterium]|nr:MAG: hypothetical protein D6791_06340 [Chloroflexota bacterium]